MAGLHDGANLDRERLATGVALAETRAGSLALQPWRLGELRDSLLAK
jgi:hypothetical protein